jgi:hypothetical protein
MLHACVERFDVMGGRGNILGWVGEVNKASNILMWSARSGHSWPSQLCRHQGIEKSTLTAAAAPFVAHMF